jgi:hypothetical protein
MGWERVEVPQPVGGAGTLGHQSILFASEAGSASVVGNHRLAGPGLRRRWIQGSAASVAGAVKQLNLVPHLCHRPRSRFSKTYWQKSKDSESPSYAGGATLRLSQLSTELGGTKTSQAPTNSASGVKDAEHIATDGFAPQPRPSKSHLPANRMLSGQTPRPSWRLKMLPGNYSL